MLEPDKREFVFYNSLSFEHPDYDIASSELEKKYTIYYKYYKYRFAMLQE